MEFLVTITLDWSALRERPDLRDLIDAERQVGLELLADGVIRRIWRIPGRRANVGIWQADDASALVAHLDRLPLRSWLDADVVPLAVHELESLAQEMGTTVGTQWHAGPEPSPVDHEPWEQR